MKHFNRLPIGARVQDTLACLPVSEQFYKVVNYVNESRVNFCERWVYILENECTGKMCQCLETLADERIDGKFRFERMTE